MSVNHADEENVQEIETLERELAHALQPVDPPEGFAERVLARAEQFISVEPAVPVDRKQFQIAGRHSLFQKSRWLSGAIAALLLFGVFFAKQAYTHHQQQKAELAERQFEAGLQITDLALERVREQLQRTDLWLGDHEHFEDR
jgi:hypothetical protein